MHPTPEALQIMTIEQIAEKDLPVGVTTYSIVEDSVIPTDRSFRNSWVGNAGLSTATVVEDMPKEKNT